MTGLTSTTVIQTTWRSPFIIGGHKEVRIAFKSCTDAWVSFRLEMETGIIHDIQGFAPEHQIPDWYSDTPFKEWSITVDESHTVQLNGNSVVQFHWGSKHPSLKDFLTAFSPETICALWIGRYGYSILTS